MALNGWVKAHRQMLDHWVSQEPEMFACWMRLLLEANHSETKRMFNGTLTTVKRGQLVFGLEAFSHKSGISVKKLRRYLDLLEKEGMIGRQKTSKYSLISIVNYSEYQPEGSQKASEWQAEGKQKASKGQHRENGKNVENGEEKDMHGPQQAESEPSVIDLPTNKHGTQGEVYGVPQSQVDLWQEDYPAVSVISELHKARSWLDSNPAKRKTSQGMKRFLNNWLSRAQDRGGSPQLSGQQQRRQPKDFFG